MTTRRIELRARTKQPTETSEGLSLIAKRIKDGDQSHGSIRVWIILILIVLVAYHSYIAYNEEMAEEERERKEGMDCLYQFKIE
jgi:hypothetical protein